MSSLLLHSTLAFACFAGRANVQLSRRMRSVDLQDNVSWALGFGIPAMAMAFAVLFFLAGRRRYRHVAPTESPMARVVKVVHAALKNRWGDIHTRQCQQWRR